MKVSIAWLRELIDFPWSPAELAEKLEMTGTAVEGIEQVSSPLKKVVVGKILSIQPHPQADKLVICRVDVGKKKLLIVCGAKNISVGDRVPVALVGASLPGGTRIDKVAFRSFVSEGMLCSQKELGLGEDASGILILDSHAPIGKDLKEVFALNDTVIDFEVTPNRADCMSMIGIAREVAAITGGKIRLPDSRVSETNISVLSKAKVEVKDPALCPRYSARMIEGVAVKSSPIWIQQRLIKTEVRPINNLVDITNYVMMETGQPLHAFDHERLEGRKVIVRRARAGEELVTLDGIKRRLAKDMLVIADKSGAVALAGVMGGAATEIGDVTDKVLLEAAYFEPRSIYHTAAQLDLRSESSSRFERGIDPNGTIYAANRAAKLMQELAGGKVLKGIIDVYPQPIRPKTISLRPARTNQILGTNISAKQMTTILKSLNLTVNQPPTTNYQLLKVIVPTFRPDIEREIDLMEEVARLYGYNRIASTLPESSGKQGGLNLRQRVGALIRDTLAAAGLNEVINYNFIGGRDLERTGVPRNHFLRKTVHIKNPLSEEQNILRTTLLPGLLKTIAFNVSYGQSNVQVFEMGRVFFASGKEILPEEKIMVAGAAMGSWQSDQWHEKAKEIDFYDLKGIIEVLLSRLGIKKWNLKKASLPMFHPGRAAEIVVKGERIGLLGELHPLAVQNYQLPKSVVAFELDEDKLAKYASLEIRAEAPSRFPAISYDIALIVDERITAEEVDEVIRKSGGKLLSEVHLFDVYRGKPIAKGKKSLAYTLVYQASDRTLMEEEAKKVQQNVLKALKEKLGATIRT